VADPGHDGTVTDTPDADVTAVTVPEALYSADGDDDTADDVTVMLTCELTGVTVLVVVAAALVALVALNVASS